MKAVRIVSIVALAIWTAGCFSPKQQDSARESIMQGVEERQQRERDERKAVREAHFKDLPGKLRTLARTKGSNQLAVARQLVELVPLQDVKIEGTSVVGIVKTVKVDIPPFTAKLERGLLAGRNPVSRYRAACESYEKTIENIKINTRSNVFETTRAPQILTTLATHDITLTFRLVMTKHSIPLEEIEFRPADTRACMAKLALEPGDALNPIQFESLVRPSFSSWPVANREPLR